VGSRKPTLGVLKEAHKHSIRHREEIAASERCGCFYCLAIFEPAAITDWVDEHDVTALCPKCGIDSVIGTASGFPIADFEFLTAMKEHWFEGT
jgi:hypothetical protein